LQKSNIKDVCALLDMKSSKIKIFIMLIDIDDVNKAFNEMSDELASKIQAREFREALNE
jgi:hypothetical protein